MAQCIDSNASGKVQISTILNIPQITPFAFNHHWRRTDICRYHVWGMLTNNRSSLGVWRRIGSRQGGFFLNRMSVKSSTVWYSRLTEMLWRPSEEELEVGTAMAEALRLVELASTAETQAMPLKLIPTRRLASRKAIYKIVEWVWQARQAVSQSLGNVKTRSSKIFQI